MDKNFGYMCEFSKCTITIFSFAVNSLSYSNSSKSVSVEDNVIVINGIQFRWDYVVTYVGLWFLQGGGFGKLNLLFYLELSLNVIIN